MDIYQALGLMCIVAIVLMFMIYMVVSYCQWMVAQADRAARRAEKKFEERRTQRNDKVYSIDFSEWETDC